MKPSQQPKRPSRSRREQGIALVTVLAILTLTAVMVMAFFTISRSELTSSTVYARGQEASQLAKTAVDMVIHQIRAATEQGGVAWASQPGMIRTWDQNGFHGGYKLYSDESMVLGDESDVFDDAQDLGQWQNDVRYVDLNEPVVRTYGSQSQYFYPIVDPVIAFGALKVQGFDVNFGAVGVSPSDRRLPMPVKWIYQLQDGTLGTLLGSGSAGQFKSLVGNVMPTRDNPIVARFAFWADDETSKLNVNTAAGGVAWDTPRAGGVSDRRYGQFQPVANEFQRYPGHPASTSLIHVLFPGAALPNDSKYDHISAEAFYDLVPRVQRGGTKGGGYAGTAQQYARIEPIQPDRDRLYATIDEFIFRAPDPTGPGGRTGAGFLRQEQRKVGSWGNVRPEDVGRLQFLITTTSKAPEVTIFNTPRVSVWPSYYGDPESSGSPDVRRYTTYDRRLRFCAEVGTKDETADPKAKGKFSAQYHFQRMNAASRTKDYTEIRRNQELYAYLQEMMSTEIPGLDSSDGVTNHKSFEAKYGALNRDQILTEIFDYIRSLNLFDDLLMKQQKEKLAVIPRAPAAFRTSQYYGYWRPGDPNQGDHISFTPGRLGTYRAPDLMNGHPQNVGADAHSGHGQVAPIEIGQTKGFGRFFGIREVGISLITCAQDNGSPGGVSRQAAGITNIGSNNEGWSLNNSVLPGGIPPGHDYSNVPPLSSTTKQHVFDIYQIGSLIDPATGMPFNVSVLDDNNKQIPSTPPMGGLEFYEYVTAPGNWNRVLPEDQPLTNGDSMVQGALLVSLFCPSKGWTLINPDFRLQIELQGDFKLNGENLALNQSGFIKSPHASFRNFWGGRDHGGVLEPRMLMGGHRKVPNPGADGLAYNLTARYAPPRGQLQDDPARGNPDPAEGPEANLYPWIGVPVKVKGQGGGKPAVNAQLDGATVIVTLFPDGGARSNGASARDNKVDPENAGPNEYSQRATIVFAPESIPLPDLAGGGHGHTWETPRVGSWKAVPNSEVRPKENWAWHRDGAFRGQDHRGQAAREKGRMAQIFGHQGYGWVESFTTGGNTLVRREDVVRSYLIPHGDDRVVFAKRDVGTASGEFVKHPGAKGPNNGRIATNFSPEHANTGYGRDQVLVQSFTPRANPPDSRKPLLPDTFVVDFDCWSDWDNGVAAELDGAFINKPDEGNAMGVAYDNYEPKPWLVGSVSRSFIPYFTDPWVQEPAGPGLWSPNRIMPGPGMFGSLPTGVYSKSGGQSQPWQTLLFRRIAGSPADSKAGRSPRTGKVHPGWEHPRDHYLLDFFWMPVVEPYSISEPLATAGKVNMNFAIQPFSYIKRKTSLLGVFSSEELLTIPNRLTTPGAANQPNGYKEGGGWGTGYNRTTHSGGNLQNMSLRSWISLDETLKQFDMLSNAPNDPISGKGQIFRTASQICEQWLVPGKPVQGNPYGPVQITLQNVSDWYNPDSSDKSFGLVGDNARERPYTNLVARLTTKSNTFTVHYRAQIVRQTPVSPTTAGQRRSDVEFRIFDSTVDQMVGEFRGSSIIERYIDPNDDRIPDFAAMAGAQSLNLLNPATQTLDKFYRFRTVSEKRFAP